MLESLGVFLSQDPLSFCFFDTVLVSHNQQHMQVVLVPLLSLITHSKMD